MAQLSAVVGALAGRYDPSWAETWDSVGLVCGDPEAEVEKVHFAVDPVAATAEEAISLGAQLLVTHHPLFLGGTDSVAATTAKGRILHRLVTSGVALYVAHTNADVAAPGVNDALARALGLRDVQVLSPSAPGAFDKIVTFVPVDHAETVLDAITAAGAGTIGAYTRCGYFGEGVGTFTPGQGTNPTIGSQGVAERVPESRLETIAPRSARRRVVEALVAAHPYEEPAYDVYDLSDLPSSIGLGRIGELGSAMTLATFTDKVATLLPTTVWGVRTAGDPERQVRTVAVCGGSGGSLAPLAAKLGADVLVTSDLKHHSTAEAVADLGIGLVDAAHWATEWPWLPQAADILKTDLAATGIKLEATVSAIVTDPWSCHSR